MKAIHWITAVAALAFVQPAPASGAVGSPEVIIYRFPGVFDDGGGDHVGTATIFICTNFSGVTETMRFVTRAPSTTALITNITFSIDHLQSKVVATHGPASTGADIGLFTSAVLGGTTAIAATSTNIICTAMVLDAASTKVIGVALRGIRFNPVPGSQE